MEERSAEEIREMAERLLREQSTVTLATSRGGDPWAAPVYFVYHRGGLYFFSSPSSRHVEQGLAAGQCAAAVFEDSKTWRGIRGLQMSGSLREVTSPGEKAEAFGHYLLRYPFVKEMLPPGEGGFRKLFDKFRVGLYRFQPSAAYYTDNSVGFGFRREVRLEGMEERVAGSFGEQPPPKG